LNSQITQPSRDSNSGGNSSTHLRKLVKQNANMDLYRCQGCGSCNNKLDLGDLDVSLDSLIQMVQQNDDEILTSKTLWSESVFRSIQYACKRGINLQAVFKTLRTEAIERGIQQEITK
jgi:heterodisulfide reductase subunit C